MLALPGGALDGIKEPERGFVIRGGREMENHFECLWDLFRSVPSLEIERAVPEVFGSTYDVRELLKATGRLRDSKEITVHGPDFLRRRILHRLDQTEIGELLTEYKLL